MADGRAAMGVGTTRTMERVAAALGGGGIGQAPTRFGRADDVSNGGVLCALAALLGFGLLSRAREHFGDSKGYYPMESIFLLLAFMALGRVPSLEQQVTQKKGAPSKALTQ